MRVMIVDDDKSIRALLAKFLEIQGYETATAADGYEAIAALSAAPFDLVLSDMRMPGMSGMQLLRTVTERFPDVGVLMLTACEDVSLAVNAMKTGALDYLTKPFDLPEVAASVRRAMERRKELRGRATRLRQLEQTVMERTAELRHTLQSLNDASENTIEALVAALDAREHETRAHSRRVSDYTTHLARGMNVDPQFLDDIRRGAMLHDIGKIGVPDGILLKPGPLTDTEWLEMRKHPQIGYWILRNVEGLREAAEIVLSHHERHDGRGYPRGIAGDAIPLGARIFSVADSLDAITSDRPYHGGQPYARARAEIAAHSGTQFDPAVVDCFLGVPEEVWASLRERSMREAPAPVTPLPQVVLA